ncbi:hypothetical protein C8Q70DRAFT_988711 [Cubamyces menziesii]|nr:hypothetical protein C8Q70DRAFT_988711 [Cubamyces menziesii]
MIHVCFANSPHRPHTSDHPSIYPSHLASLMHLLYHFPFLLLLLFTLTYGTIRYGTARQAQNLLCATYTVTSCVLRPVLSCRTPRFSPWVKMGEARAAPPSRVFPWLSCVAGLGAALCSLPSANGARPGEGSWLTGGTGERGWGGCFASTPSDFLSCLLSPTPTLFFSWVAWLLPRFFFLRRFDLRSAFSSSLSLLILPPGTAR